MVKNLPLVLLFAVVLAVPFVLRPAKEAAGKSDRTLVVVSPHNEAIRHEFEHGFREFWKAKTGENVKFDWRTPGGVSEIARFLAGEYFGAFEFYWTRDLKKPWTPEARAAFDNSKLNLDDTPADDTDAESARRAFLTSDVGIGIDVFFGGGSFDFSQQAEAGRLVDSGALKRHPELFGETAIPQSLGGEVFWDKHGRWIGTCLGAFGICYNTDSLKRLEKDRPPQQWSDLGKPGFFGEIALTDPTKSGSAAKAFEMLIQQQIHETVNRALASGQDEKTAVAEGWANAMRLLQRIGANARYFTDAGSKPAIDVSLGDSAAGMSIDFYGRFQSESVQRPDGSSRIIYFTPTGGSSTGSDPVGLLRGAKEPELGKAFIDWLLTLEAQKLWNFKLGTPGGPEKYALRRLPIRRELYAPEWHDLRSDPDVDAYADAASFTYRGDWTASLFNPMRLIIRVMCLDTSDELRAAWKALIDAGMPPEAVATFDDVSVISYEAASTKIREALRSANRIEEVRLSKELGDVFRAKYRKAAEQARQRL